MKDFTVVIPAYNEADKISSTLTQVTSFFINSSAKENMKSFEIIVVDDGSTDSTVQKVQDYALENPEVILVKNPHKGKGIAVWTGVMRASGRYIYLCDADLSTPIGELKKLLVWMTDHNFDIVIASREGIGAQRVGEPLYRHLMGRVFNFMTQQLVLPGIKDTQCGFKLFKAEVAKKIFSSLKVYNPQIEVLKRAYMGAFDVEVLFLAGKMGYTIKEVPVLWKFVKTTRLSPLSDSINMFVDVVRVRINDAKGAYSIKKDA